MRALLDAFPEAVVIVLPGGLRDRAIPTEYQLGMLETMAERDVPGCFHLGTEFSYCVRDDETSLATTRFEDPAPALLVSRSVADYWRRRCSIARGVWPTHMVETPDRAYAEQPWKKEVEELRRQVTVLRSTAKRYIWSYSGAPMWYAYTPEIEQKYKLTKSKFRLPDIDAPLGRVSEHEIHRGRDDGVRWFRYDNLDPIGATSPRTIFGFSNVDDSGARLYLGGKIIVDALEYPPKGKGLVHRDKLLFERHIPVIIAKGVTRLAVTTMDLRGKRLYSLRLTDGDGLPFDDVRFRLE